MFCWHCGTLLPAEGAACPFCGYLVCPAEAEEMTVEELAPACSWLGSLPARWERLLCSPRRRRVARAGLEGALVVLLLALSLAAWRGFVSGAWGTRLRGMDQIVFVGGYGSLVNSGALATARAGDGGPEPVVGQLYTIRPDGSGLRLLTRQANTGYFSPAWSPDGAHLAAFALTADPGFLGTLVLMEADGSHPRLVPQVAAFLPGSDGLGLFGPPANRTILWSPDGRRLVATVSTTEFDLLNADGSAAEEITGSLPAWSPDGHALAFFQTVPGPKSGGAQPLNLAVWDTVSAQPRVLSDLPMLTAQALAWSPDGRLLAYSGQFPPTAASQQFLPVTGALLAARPDGTGAHLVAEWENGLVGQMAWSPDGKQVAVVVNRLIPALDGSGNVAGIQTELWVVNSDGSTMRSLGPSAADAPSWAPDGRHLVFASAQYDRLEIADTNAQPMALHSFAVRHIYVWAPVWSALPGLVGPSS